MIARQTSYNKQSFSKVLFPIAKTAVAETDVETRGSAKVKLRADKTRADHR